MTENEKLKECVRTMLQTMSQWEIENLNVPVVFGAMIDSFANSVGISVEDVLKLVTMAANRSREMREEKKGGGMKTSDFQPSTPWYQKTRSGRGSGERPVFTLRHPGDEGLIATVSRSPPNWYWEARGRVGVYKSGYCKRKRQGMRFAIAAMDEFHLKTKLKPSVKVIGQQLQEWTGEGCRIIKPPTDAAADSFVVRVDIVQHSVEIP